MKSPAPKPKLTITGWIREIGGSTASGRWGRAAALASIDVDEYVAMATALLTNCSAVIACCGDKSSLKERKRAYYELYYDFARRRPDISVIRVFPGNLDQSVLRKHNSHGAPGIIGVGLNESDRWTKALGLGFVVFRHSDLYSALVHWNESGRFTWTMSADPLLTLVMRDWWGTLLSREAIEAAEASKKIEGQNRVQSFVQRLGICLPWSVR